MCAATWTALLDGDRLCGDKDSAQTAYDDIAQRDGIDMQHYASAAALCRGSFPAWQSVHVDSTIAVSIAHFNLGMDVSALCAICVSMRLRSANLVCTLMAKPAEACELASQERHLFSSEKSVFRSCISANLHFYISTFFN